MYSSSHFSGLLRKVGSQHAFGKSKSHAIDSNGIEFVVEAVSKLPVFSRLNHAEKTKLAKAMVIKQCRHQDIIIKQSCVVGGLYLIQQGKAVKLNQSKENIYIKSGDCFGYECLIHDKYVSRCQIQAASPMLLYFISKSDFKVCCVFFFVTALANTIVLYIYNIDVVVF